MNRRFRHSRLRRATTLIEVLAGLVILSTLLASAAMARGRFLRQWADADQRLSAASEADQLLKQWLILSPVQVPISSRGTFAGPSRHMWSTHVIPNSAAASVGTIIVQLQISGKTAESLCQVDFLLRDPRVVALSSTRSAR